MLESKTLSQIYIRNGITVVDIHNLIKKHYPELFKFIFYKKGDSSLKAQVSEFSSKNYTKGAFLYIGLWQHIVSNEDKHEWWML